MSHKSCIACCVKKPLTDFYAHPKMSDGHLGICKECHKKRMRDRRIQKLDEVREYDRSRASLEHRRKQTSKITAEWRASHPERKKAQSAVAYAIRTNKLVRQPCFICGDKAHAHHPDYCRPLDVVWLCAAHHKQAHLVAIESEQDSSSHVPNPR